MSKKPSFSGELGLLSVFDIGQLLMLNRASGCLTLTAGSRKGFLYFSEGQVVNAVDESMREGENAAYALFAWREGAFSFDPGRPSGGTTIDSGTEGLMLEAARRLDESGGGDTSVTARVRERQDAMSALRDVFTSVARDARDQGRGAAAGGGEDALAALGGAGERLLLRPGHPARVRAHGRWQPTKDAVMSAAEYADLRTRLVGDTGAEAPGAPAERRAELPGGRVVAVTRVGAGEREALWIRPLELPAPTATKLIAPPEQMSELLELKHGLVLIGGDDADTGARLLHALIAGALTRESEAIVLVSSPGVYRHREGAGVLVEVTAAGLAETLCALEPQVLAIDGARRESDGWLGGLPGVRLLLARAAGTDADDALGRWLAAFGPRDRAALDEFLRGTPALLVTAEPPKANADTLPFSVARLDDAPRRRAA